MGSTKHEAGDLEKEKRRRRVVGHFVIPFLALGAALIFLQAVRMGVTWYGRPVAGVLVDPNGVVSGIGRSTWDGIRQGLHFPDRIVAVDGAPIRPDRPDDRGKIWDEAVLRAAGSGHESVRATVLRDRSSRTVELGIARLDGLAWWAFGGALFFAGALYVLAGLIALRVSPTGPLARTFAKLAFAAGVFLMTLLDFHTSRTLVPLFLIAFATLPFAIVGLLLSLPVDVRWLRRHPWLTSALDYAGVLVAAILVLSYGIGHSTTGLQAVWTPVFAISLLAFPVGLVVRYFRATGQARSVLRSLLLPGIPCGLAGGLLLLAPQGVWPSDIDVVSFPALALAPLSTVYAFVRHDLWGSRAILSRVTSLAAGSALACAIATGLAAAFGAELGVPFRSALLTALLASSLAGTLVAAALIWGERLVFPARAGYKPTIEQLSRELTSLTSPHEVALAVERTIARWLPCDRIELVPVVQEISPSLARDGGEGVRLPLMFEDRPLAVLAVGEKRGGTLFTADDVDLLRTIANQAGLAMAHALAYEELERRRKEQASAWHGERLAIVETMASEVAHEVRYPINFFRSLFDRGSEGGGLSNEDVDIGRIEVERLEHLVSGLRRVAIQSLDRRRTRLAELCSRAELLMRDTLGERQLAPEGQDDVVVSCDREKVTQILVNLLSNALDAAGPTGTVGIECRATEQGAELSVWDTGPGFSGDPMQLFAPWFTTKTGGTGLGLAITLRLARAHGWNVVPSRQGERTVFTLTIPSRDILTGSDDESAGNAEVA